MVPQMRQVAKTRLLAVAVTTLVFIAVVSSAYSQTGSLRPRGGVITGEYYPAWMGHPDQPINLDQPGWNPIPVTGPRAGPPKVEDDAASRTYTYKLMLKNAPTYSVPVFRDGGQH
jgi:hypothetical protein